MRSNQRKENEAYAGSATVFFVRGYKTNYSQLHFTQQLYKLTQTGFEFLCP